MLINLLSVLLLLVLQAAPAAKPSPDLAGIAHVALRVTDVPKSREFYHTLGFEEAFAFSDPGKPPVSYLKVNDRQFIELYQRSDDAQPLGLMHVCYEVRDIDALHEYYVARGVKAPPAKKARAGNLLFVLRDPEDQVVEFTEYMPGSLHYEARGKHLGESRVSEHMVRATIPVKEVEAERSFYSSRLGFDDEDGKGVVQLRLPGGSGDEIELQAGTTTRVAFEVADLARTAKDLQKRALSIQKNDRFISVADPDGTLIVFTLAAQTR
ncbi:MAG TPA: VOC family protein [Terriglobales bacterium]|nr:VOC family protein [Terriglobales bacterium]